MRRFVLAQLFGADGEYAGTGDVDVALRSAKGCLEDWGDAPAGVYYLIDPAKAVATFTVSRKSEVTVKEHE